jgi:hypothetical protein
MNREKIGSREMTEKEMWKFFRKADSRIFPLNWLSYLKNTNSFFQKLFKITRSK